MRLTLHSNYAIRLLMYCALHPDDPVPVTTVAAAYRISDNHLAKIAQTLVRIGVVETHRGRNGGISLTRRPDRISIGEVLRATENEPLAECFAPDRNTCLITPECRLRPALHLAMEAFYGVLDRLTLADLVAEPEGLMARLALGERAA